MIQKFGEDNFRYFSKNLMDAATGESIPLPEPNTFLLTLQRVAAQPVKDLEISRRLIQTFCRKS